MLSTEYLHWIGLCYGATVSVIVEVTFPLISDQGFIRELPHVPGPPQPPRLFVAPRYHNAPSHSSSAGTGNFSENLIAESSEEARSFEGNSTSSEDVTTRAPEVLSIAKWNQDGALRAQRRSEDLVDGPGGNWLLQNDTVRPQEKAKDEEVPLSLAITVDEEKRPIRKTGLDRSWNRETPPYTPPRARKKGNLSRITTFIPYTMFLYNIHMYLTPKGYAAATSGKGEDQTRVVGSRGISKYL